MPGADDLRASDSDRDRAAEVVRDAAGEGRLDLAELEERLGQIFQARTYGELARITHDLPATQGPSETARGAGRRESGPIARPGPNDVSALLGQNHVEGAWVVPPRMTARAVLGEVRLDFTDATIPHQVTLDVMVAAGKVELVVPDDIAVVFEEGGTMLGSRKNRTRATPSPGTPLIRVRGPVMLGELEAKPPRRSWFRGRR